jgi:hypothetical protein
MKRVIVESPYQGDIALNTMYAQFACHDCLVNHNEAPYASHLLYTQPHILRDEEPGERKLGINAGFNWRAVSELSAFYQDLGISEGMLLGMADCAFQANPFKERTLPDDLWKRFTHACGEAGLQIPQR